MYYCTGKWGHEMPMASAILHVIRHEGNFAHNKIFVYHGCEEDTAKGTSTVSVRGKRVL